MDEYKLKPVMKPGRWRVDGVSRALYSKKQQIGLRFVLSQIDPSASDPYSSEASTGNEPISMNLSAQWLSFLTAGSIWEAGESIDVQTQAPKALHSQFEIDLSAVQYKPFNFRANLDGVWDNFVNPEFLDQTTHKALATSSYALAPIKGHKKYKWMVIPCSELIRFYMAPTKRLSYAVMNGAIEKLATFQKFENGVVTLADKVGLTRYEALILGRAYTSEFYLAALNSINKGFMRTSVGQHNIKRAEALSINATFPIAGTTRLKVAGVPMNLAGSQANAIFAMEILSCSSPPAYSEIILTQASRSGGGGKESAQPDRPHFFTLKQIDLEKIVNDEPADARLPRQAMKRYVSPPWSDSITIHCRRVENPAGWKTFRARIPLYPIGNSAGEGSSAGTDASNQGKDLNNEILQNPNSRITDFIAMIEALEKLQKHNWTFSSLTPNKEIPVKGKRYTASQFPTKIGGRWTWHYLSGELRQLACIQVSLDADRFFYILEIEYSTSPHCTALLRKNDFKALEEEDLTEFLKLTVYCNGWPTLENTLQKTEQIKAVSKSAAPLIRKFQTKPLLLIEKIKHLKNPSNAEDWSAMVLSRIEGWL